MIIDCISDLHGYFPELKGGDLLIIAGDITTSDKIPEWKEFFDWLKNQEYRKKIMIAGNHDNFLTQCIPIAVGKEILKEEFHEEAGLEGYEYLCDSGTEFEGLKIWGMPWTPLFFGQNPYATAFTLPRAEMYKKVDMIPDDIDILISHGPPYGIFDSVNNYNYDKTLNVGCNELRKRVINSNSKIDLHVFGHIHEHGGKIMSTPLTTFINASHVNEVYDPVNPSIRVIIDPELEQGRSLSVLTP